MHMTRAKFTRVWLHRKGSEMHAAVGRNLSHSEVLQYTQPARLNDVSTEFFDPISSTFFRGQIVMLPAEAVGVGGDGGPR
jgi:hypothetical protein